MEKEFIGYSEALALKELGFSSPYAIGGYQGGAVFYYEKGELYYDGRPMYSSDAHSGQLLAPLYQQIFRWFREKYNLWNMIYPRDGWNYSIQIIDETISCTGESWHKVEMKSYEEAELECLKKLIEIVKEMNNCLVV